MTLAQWLETSKRAAHAHGRMMWIADGGETETKRAELWCLTDYRVSSVSGGTIWLLPRD